MIKFVNQNNCDIAGGPQYHDIKNKIFKIIMMFWSCPLSWSISELGSNKQLFFFK